MRSWGDTTHSVDTLRVSAETVRRNLAGSTFVELERVIGTDGTSDPSRCLDPQFGGHGGEAKQC